MIKKKSSKILALAGDLVSVETLFSTKELIGNLGGRTECRIFNACIPPNDRALYAGTVPVKAISDSEIRVYDRSRENASLGAIINGDFLFLFDSTGAAITGATSVVVFDTSITNPSSDVDFNAANYTTAASGLLSLSGTYSRTGTTVTTTKNFVRKFYS